MSMFFSDSTKPISNPRPMSSCFAVIVVSFVGAVLAALALGIALGVVTGEQIIDVVNMLYRE